SASPSGPAAPGAVGQGWGAASPRLHRAPEWCRSCVSSVITLNGLLGFLRGRRYAIGVPLGVTRDGDDAVARVGFRENDPLGGAPGEVDLADGGAHDLATLHDDEHLVVRAGEQGTDEVAAGLDEVGDLDPQA